MQQKFFDSRLLSFFPFSTKILSFAEFTLRLSQLQARRLVTSRIRSRIESSITTSSILVLLLYTNLTQNQALLAVFDGI